MTNQALNFNNQKANGVIRFLMFGDVVGRPGREAIKQALLILKQKYRPDHVIVNVENMAHGKGISPQTMEEALKWEADVLTTGDHAWDNEAGIQLLENKKLPILRPANYPDGVPGKGFLVFSSGVYQVAVIQLQGQVFFKNDPENPFSFLDKLLEREEIKQADIKLVEFHVEATSEARAMGWHADGRVSAVWGTHTHVPTADAQVMPKGTGYITDIGMCGNYHSIIGGSRGLLKSYTSQMRMKFEIEESGPLEAGALLLDIDPRSGRTINVAHIRKIINDV